VELHAPKIAGGARTAPASSSRPRSSSRYAASDCRSWSLFLWLASASCSAARDRASRRAASAARSSCCTRSSSSIDGVGSGTTAAAPSPFGSSKSSAGPPRPPPPLRCGDEAVVVRKVSVDMCDKSLLRAVALMPAKQSCVAREMKSSLSLCTTAPRRDR